MNSVAVGDTIARLVAFDGLFSTTYTRMMQLLAYIKHIL